MRKSKSDIQFTLLQISGFVLNLMFKRNTSKFATFYIYGNPKLLFLFFISCNFIFFPNECPGLCIKLSTNPEIGRSVQPMICPMIEAGTLYTFTKTLSCLFRFSFRATLFFYLMNALVYVDIDQGIH